jgi:transcriptional regulator with XRE-family HTH domain
MNALQLKMARVALGLGVKEAAALTGVSHDTITRLEGGQTLKPATVAKVRAAFEAQHIEFTNGRSPGVRIHFPDGSSLEAPAALPASPLEPK